MYLKIHYKNIEVRYSFFLNGGGILFAHEFVRIISQKIGKVEHIFEYCAGPGFIGFSLLANNLCDRLTLADVNPRAIEAIKETIKNNNLQDKVTVYQSDCLDSIPESEQWDLVVGNPPWYLCSKDKKDIMVCDPGSRVHEKFFQGINKFLKPNGSILFIEGGEYTNVVCFKDMLENNGLRIIEPVRSVSFLEIFKNLDEYSGLKISLIILLRFGLFFRQGYFIWSKRNEELLRKYQNINMANKSYSNGKGYELMVPAYSIGEIIQIARKQKALFWLFLGLSVAYLLTLTPVKIIILPIFSIWAIFVVYQSALALKRKWLGLYIFCTLVPVVNLIVILQLMWKSFKVLRMNKIAEAFYHGY